MKINRPFRKNNNVFLFICFFTLISGVFLVIFSSNIRRCIGKENNKINILFFYSDECEHCIEVEELVLEPLIKIYPFTVEKICIDDTDGYERLRWMEEITGDTGNEIPVIFIGNRALSGVKEIETEFEYVIRELIESQEISGDSTVYTSPPKLSPERESVQPKKISKEQINVPVYAVYFYKPGCKECDRAYKDMNYLKSKYSNLVLKEYDITDQNSTRLNEAISIICKVPVKKRLTAPSLFVGKDYLLGDAIRVNDIENLIKKYTDYPVPPVWEMAREKKEEAERNILTRFYGLSVSAIIGLGLFDGINPCAFATIIFFISYLAYIGKRGKEILLVGSAFTFAVFISYMLIGLGFLSFIIKISFLPLLSKIMYLATAAFAFVLGVLNLRDFFICKSGKIADMKLQLPNFIKKKIHKTIRKEAKLKHYVLGAIVTGFVISILELLCTGQVYLPTIIYVTSVKSLRLQAISYLFLYNLMFITPLCGIFLAVYKGTSSQQLTAFLQKYSAFIKLGLSIFFFILAIILVVSVI